MKPPRSPKFYPHLIVSIAAISMFSLLSSHTSPSMTLPILLFWGSMFSLIFGVSELCFSLMGWYKTKDDVYRSISRAITAFGVVMCFLLLISAYESAK
jgi:hypothetical protein